MTNEHRHSLRRSAAVLAVTVILAGCVERPAGARDAVSTPTVVRIGATLSTVTTIHEVAAVMPDIQFETLTRYGSLPGIASLNGGERDLVFSYADVAYMAFVGRLPDASAPATQVRAVAVLDPSTLHVLVGKRSGLYSISQFRGKRVALGRPRGATALMAELVLKAFGLMPSDVDGMLMDFPEGVRRLLGGEVDAVFVSGEIPHPAVAEGIAGGARLLEVSGSPVDRLHAAYPFHKLTVIPGGAYTGYPRPVRTIGVDGLLTCRADLDENLVYRLTKAFFELPDTPVDRGRAAATPIPLHPGAARYYREQELLR